MKKFRSFLPLLVLIALGIALLSTGVLNQFRPDNLAHEQAHLQALIAQYPILAGLLHIGTITLAIATGIPALGSVCVFAGGMLFGVVAGTALSLSGITLGSTILFLASRHAFGDHSHGGTPGLVSRLRGGYHAQPISYTFFLRLVPFFPFGGVTVALAWLRCPLWLFMTATALGGFAMTSIETWLGASLARNIGTNKAISTDLLHDPQVLWPMICLGLLAMVPILISNLRARRNPNNV